MLLVGSVAFGAILSFATPRLAELHDTNLAGEPGTIAPSAGPAGGTEANVSVTAPSDQSALTAPGLASDPPGSLAPASPSPSRIGRS